jgi:predicted protein tyrosine phosphatase
VRLLIHCQGGVCRSTAAAYLALALRHGPGQEAAAFGELLLATRKPWPNRRMTELADRILARDGRLLAPLDAYRARYPRRLEAYIRLERWHPRAVPVSVTASRGST